MHKWTQVIACPQGVYTTEWWLQSSIMNVPYKLQQVLCEHVIEVNYVWVMRNVSWKKKPRELDFEKSDMLKKKLGTENQQIVPFLDSCEQYSLLPEWGLLFWECRTYIQSMPACLDYMLVTQQGLANQQANQQGLGVISRATPAGAQRSMLCCGLSLGSTEKYIWVPVLAPKVIFMNKVASSESSSQLPHPETNDILLEYSELKYTFPLYSEIFKISEKANHLSLRKEECGEGH